MTHVPTGLVNRFRCARRTARLLLLALASWVAVAPSRANDVPQGPVPAQVGTKRALILCGLPGDAEHRALFAGAVEKLRKALVEHAGFPEAEVLVRFGTESKSGDGPALAGSRGLSTRERIEADVAELRKRLAPADTLWVIVIGHAHHDGRQSHLNLPGPDLAADAFGALFKGIKAKEQVLLITTSASGYFLKPLAAPGRVVITATEADQEVNETLFPLALADVLETPPMDIDRDKDGSISVLELYLAVAGDVLKRYADGEDIPTEHAQLDDNGDGHGSELQLNYLPPELGGRTGKGPTPAIGPKDDGFLAAKLRVGPVPAAPKP